MAHLVAIPFSDPTDGARAVRALLAGPRRPGLEVELIAMVHPLRAGKVAVFVSAERAKREARAAADRWLSPLRQQLEAASVPTRTSVAVGSPTRTLRHLAERRDFAQLMIADTSSTPWRSWLRHAVLRSAQPAITFVP